MLCQYGQCPGKMEVLVSFRNGYSLGWLKRMCSEKMLENKVEKSIEKAPKKLFRLYPPVSRKPVGVCKEGCDTADVSVSQFSHQRDWQRYPSELFDIFSIVSADRLC